MKKVVNSIMCSNEEDLERFASMIDSEIQNGKIETFPKYKSFVNKKEEEETNEEKEEGEFDGCAEGCDSAKTKKYSGVGKIKQENKTSS